MMYDTFHAHIEEADPRAALNPCADVLVHFHASENHRGTPGSGQVDWDTTFAALAEIGYDGWVVIEAFGDSLPELAAATKVWRRTFTERGAARARRSGLPSAPPAATRKLRRGRPTAGEGVHIAPQGKPSFDR